MHCDKPIQQEHLGSLQSKYIWAIFSDSYLFPFHKQFASIIKLDKPNPMRSSMLIKLASNDAADYEIFDSTIFWASFTGFVLKEKCKKQIIYAKNAYMNYLINI